MHHLEKEGHFFNLMNACLGERSFRTRWVGVNSPAHSCLGKLQTLSKGWYELEPGEGGGCPGLFPPPHDLYLNFMNYSGLCCGQDMRCHGQLEHGVWDVEGRVNPHLYDSFQKEWVPQRPSRQLLCSAPGVMGISLSSLYHLVCPRERHYEYARAGILPRIHSLEE